MSQLEELVHEISFTVDKLSTKINEERERIKNFKVRQQELIKQNNEIQQSNEQLQADIERLEKTIYREMQQTEQLSKANELVEQRIQSLNKTLTEIDKAGEKMRSEKNILLEEYRDRINSYENCIQKNAILRNFVENWRCQVKRNKELVTFPAVIVNLAAHLEKFYSCNITGQLEALVCSREAQGDTLLDDPVPVVTKNHTHVSPASKNPVSTTTSAESATSICSCYNQKLICCACLSNLHLMFVFSRCVNCCIKPSLPKMIAEKGLKGC